MSTEVLASDRSINVTLGRRRLSIAGDIGSNGSTLGSEGAMRTEGSDADTMDMMGDTLGSVLLVQMAGEVGRKGVLVLALFLRS